MMLRVPSWLVAVAVAAAVPTAVAGQSHGLARGDHVRLWHGGTGTPLRRVVGSVRDLSQDSVGLVLADRSSLFLAWSEVRSADVWRVDKPRRYDIAVVGAVVGAIVGGFVAVGRDQNSMGSLTGPVVKGALVASVPGALVGTGLSYLIRAHSWHAVEVHPSFSGAAWAGVPLSVAVEMR